MFPCRDEYYDYYEDWKYEDYCDEDEVIEDEFNEMNQDYGIEKENCLKGFVKRLLLFILSKL